MFGLAWEEGTATIVARQTHEGLYHGQGPSGMYHHTYDFVADVAPDSGAPVFRATFTELFSGDTERRPDVGQQARVRFHAKSEKVKLDRAALRTDAEQAQDTARGSFDAIANAPAGSSSPAPETDLASDVAAIAQETAAFREQSAQIRERADLIGEALRAKASGDQAELARLKATLAQQLATVGDMAPEPPGHAAQAAPSDSIERLTNLAELRARGVLTEAEFAAEKAKILDGE